MRDRSHMKSAEFPEFIYYPFSGFEIDLDIKIHATSVPPPCADVMCESSPSAIVKSNSRQLSTRLKFVECNFEMSTPSFQNLSGQIAA